MLLQSEAFDVLIEDEETQNFQLSTTIVKRQLDQLKILLEQKRQELNECYQNIRILSKNSIKLTKKLMETNEFYLQMANRYEISQRRVAELQNALKTVIEQSLLKSKKITEFDIILLEKTKIFDLLEQEIARRQMIQEQLNFKCNELFKKISKQEKQEVMIQDSNQLIKLRTQNEDLQKQKSTAQQNILQIATKQLAFNLTIEKAGLFDYQQKKLLDDKINKLKQSKDEILSTNILVLKQWLNAKNTFILNTYGIVS